MNTESELTPKAKTLLEGSTLSKWLRDNKKGVYNEIRITENGIGLSFVLDNQKLIKFFSPRYIWDTKTPDKSIKAFDNYKLLQDLSYKYTPKILETGYGKEFESNYVIIDFLVNSKDLFLVYKDLDSDSRFRLLDKIVLLVKNFHSLVDSKDFVLAHQDLHFGNFLLDEKADLYLIDFDKMEKGLPSGELYGLLQGFLLPSSCCSEELEKFYQLPLLKELVHIFENYSELFEGLSLLDLQKVYEEVFTEKRNIAKFQAQIQVLDTIFYTQKLFEKIFNQDWNSCRKLIATLNLENL